MTKRRIPRRTVADRPSATMTRRDIRALMTNLDSGPGWYASRTLYARHLEMCTLNGVKAMTRILFGKALRAAGCEPQSRSVLGLNTRGWLIPRDVLHAITINRP